MVREQWTGYLNSVGVTLVHWPSFSPAFYSIPSSLLQPVSSLPLHQVIVISYFTEAIKEIRLKLWTFPLSSPPIYQVCASLYPSRAYHGSGFPYNTCALPFQTPGYCFSNLPPALTISASTFYGIGNSSSRKSPGIYPYQMAFWAPITQTYFSSHKSKRKWKNPLDTLKLLKVTAHFSFPPHSKIP